MKRNCPAAAASYSYSDVEDFEVSDDFLQQGIGSLVAGSSSAASSSTTVLDSPLKAPPRFTKRMVCDLTLMADGRLGGSDGKAIKLYGADAQLTAENLLPEHVPNMRLLIERVKVSGIGLPKFVRVSTLFSDTMGFESTCFSEDNFSLQPLLAACDEGRSDILLFLALCRLFTLGISHAALAGPPGRQANDSCAGASAVFGASKLALIELMSEFEEQLAARDLNFEKLFEMFNLFDTGDGCCRVNFDDGDDDDDDGKNCSSYISEMQELNLELLVTLLNNAGVAVRSIVGFAASPRFVASRLADCLGCHAPESRLGPSHIKYWRGKPEEIVSYKLRAAAAMAPAWLQLLHAMGFDGLPESDALELAIYDRLCALKLLDQPSLAPLPSHAEARAWEPNEEQRKAAAVASVQRFWRRIAAENARGKELLRRLQLHEHWRAKCERVLQRFAPAYQAEAFEGEDGTALLLAQDGFYPPADWRLQLECACEWLELLEARHATLFAEFARLRDIALARPHQLNDVRATLVLRHIVSGNEDCVKMREYPCFTTGAGDQTQGSFRAYTDEAQVVTMSMNDVFEPQERVPRKPKRGPTAKHALKLEVVSVDIV